MATALLANAQNASTPIAQAQALLTNAAQAAAAQSAANTALKAQVAGLTAQLNALKPPVPASPTPVPVPAGSITVSPGANLNAVVAGNPAGAKFYLQAGVYRMQSVTVKDNDVFTGAPGAVLETKERAAKA